MVQTVGESQPTPAHSLDGTRRALDQAFEEIDIADLLESHSDLVINLIETIGRLERALDSRGLIGQAMGICIERYGINDQQAFQFLTRISQDQNVKLRDVAAHLVERTMSPEDSSGRE